jgi:hypothetical protein
VGSAEAAISDGRKASDSKETQARENEASRLPTIVGGRRRWWSAGDDVVYKRWSRESAAEAVGRGSDLTWYV